MQDTLRQHIRVVSSDVDQHKKEMQAMEDEVATRTRQVVIFMAKCLEQTDRYLTQNDNLLHYTLSFSLNQLIL